VAADGECASARVCVPGAHIILPCGAYKTANTSLLDPDSDAAALSITPICSRHVWRVCSALLGQAPPSTHPNTRDITACRTAHEHQKAFRTMVRQSLENKLLVAANSEQSTTPTPYKPSPLFSNSPRQSPFRRPGSIREASPSTVRPLTPNSSPLKPKETPTTPSQATLRQSTASNASQNPPAWLNKRSSTAELPPSPTRNIPSPTRNSSASTQATVRPLSTASLAARFEGGRASTPPLVERSASVEKLATTDKLAPVEKFTPYEKPLEYTPYEKPLEFTQYEKPAEFAPVKPLEFTPHEKVVVKPATRPAPLTRSVTSDALSKLPPPLLHSMRESFSVMDRDNDGHVNSADVADMLSQLGLSATPSSLAAYFNGAQSINLATFLNTLSDLLSGLSRSSELSAAFEAFDDGDDGQIDLAELKDALLHTAPEPGERKMTEREIDMVVEGFSGRRAFGKGGKGLGRGEVFRYHEFMATLTGGSGGENGGNASTPT
jgi:Ca2+-binding EF-hand superfamily protein